MHRLLAFPPFSILLFVFLTLGLAANARATGDYLRYDRDSVDLPTNAVVSSSVCGGMTGMKNGMAVTCPGTAPAVLPPSMECNHTADDATEDHSPSVESIVAAHQEYNPSDTCSPKPPTYEVCEDGSYLFAGLVADQIAVIQAGSPGYVVRGDACPPPPPPPALESQVVGVGSCNTSYLYTIVRFEGTDYFAEVVDMSGNFIVDTGDMFQNTMILSGGIDSWRWVLKSYPAPPLKWLSYSTGYGDVYYLDWWGLISSGGGECTGAEVSTKGNNEGYAHDWYWYFDEPTEPPPPYCYDWTMLLLIYKYDPLTDSWFISRIGGDPSMANNVNCASIPSFKLGY